MNECASLSQIGTFATVVPQPDLKSENSNKTHNIIYTGKQNISQFKE